MIIQCEKCGTKYRFDETVMDGEGAWVRCSRCQNVFFQANPEKKTRPDRTDHKNLINEGTPSIHNATQAEIQHGEPFQDMRSERPFEATKYFDDTELEDEEEEDFYDGEVYGGRNSKRTGRKVFKVIAYAFLSILILMILSAFLFPQIGDKFFQGLSYTQQVIRNMTGGNNGPEQLNLAQVQIQDVRQRHLKNLLVGNIRIVEGVAINQSKYDISNIKVKGNLLNDKDLVMAQEESYCGNLLTDEELIIKTEDEMRKALSNPLGSDVSNERVPPGGQIPFMIIFTREPSDIVKTTATISEAERLLP